MIERVYAFLCEFIQQNGFAPSIREIASGCYINVATVIRYLDILEAQGRIERMAGKARSIRIILEFDSIPEN
jgi:DNA-binding transcriptional regulator YhcF (GntR family)